MNRELLLKEIDNFSKFELKFMKGDLGILGQFIVSLLVRITCI